MKLYERLPDSIKVGRRRYRVDLDFRNVLRFMDALDADDVLPRAREYRALRCVMRRPPRDTAKALEAVKAICFPAIRRRAEDGEGGSQRLTSFEQDADLIRAAFRQVYGIDLWRDRVHWVEFSALLAALPEGSRYTETVGIRARPMPKATKYNADEREWLAKAKASCALRLDDREQARAYDSAVRNVFATLAGLAKGSDDNG